MLLLIESNRRLNQLLPQRARIKILRKENRKAEHAQIDWSSRVPSLIGQFVALGIVLVNKASV